MKNEYKKATEVTFYYVSNYTNFAGNVIRTFLSKQFKDLTEAYKEVETMEEISDNDLSYTPLFIVYNNDKEILHDFREVKNERNL